MFEPMPEENKLPTLPTGVYPGVKGTKLELRKDAMVFYLLEETVTVPILCVVSAWVEVGMRYIVPGHFTVLYRNADGREAEKKAVLFKYNAKDNNTFLEIAKALFEEMDRLERYPVKYPPTPPPFEKEMEGITELVVLGGNAFSLTVRPFARVLDYRCMLYSELSRVYTKKDGLGHDNLCISEYGENGRSAPFYVPANLRRISYRHSQADFSDVSNYFRECAERTIARWGPEKKNRQ